MSKPLMYFAHPTNTDNTELELDLLMALASCFPEYEIVNPNAPAHALGYRTKGVHYFLEDILPNCRACVLLAFQDGMIGTRVYAEAAAINLYGHPVWEVTLDGLIKPWVPGLERCLSIEDTRRRIRNPDGSPKPF